MPPAQLISLCSNRWSLPILAELHRRGGAKFVALERRLGVGRDSLSRTLKRLIQQGWVAKNPGYGHPLRPEYILAEEASDVGAAAAAIAAVLERQGTRDLGGRKWSLPVVAAIAGGASSFAEIEMALGVTPRALSLAVAALVTEGWVRRNWAQRYASYELTRTGRVIASPLARLGRALGR